MRTKKNQCWLAVPKISQKEALTAIVVLRLYGMQSGTNNSFAGHLDCRERYIRATVGTEIQQQDIRSLFDK